jgi:hypothetical protein
VSENGKVKPGRLLKFFLKVLTVEGDPGAAIYGTLTVGAVLAAESTRDIHLISALVGTSVAVVLYWLAHGYSAGMSRRLSNKTPLTWSGFRSDLRREWGIVEGATIPLVPTFIAAGFGMRPAAVYALGLWIVAISLIAYELLAGLAIGLKNWALLGQTAIGAVLAIGIVALKVLLG